MDEGIVSTVVLAGIFFLVALSYSSVGLGGGSSYAAILAVLGFSHTVIPTVSLTMNLVATSAGSLSYLRSGHVRLRLVLPFALTSVPAAWLGGSLDIPPDVFYWVLLVSLLFVLARIYLLPDPRLEVRLGPNARIAVSLAAGCVLGLVAGIAGIGGGIYLVPLILILGLGDMKEAAACGSIFIWVNSLAGLVGRLGQHPMDFEDLLIPAAAVFLGGLVGSRLGAYRLSPRTMQRILGVIVIVAVVFLARRLLA